MSRVTISRCELNSHRVAEDNSDTPQQSNWMRSLLFCTSCLKWKDANQFHRSRTGQYSYCRECRNEYDRRYYAERGGPARRARQRVAIDAARAWMAKIKEGVPRGDCGQVFPVYVMHSDH